MSKAQAGADRRIVTILTTTIPIVVILTLILILHSLYNFARRPLRAILAPVFAGVLVSLSTAYLPALVEDSINHGRLPISEIHLKNAEQNSLHFDVADMHCDALLWGARDLSKTQYHPLDKSRALGTVDIPRLVKGRVKLQVFAAVNEVPHKQNFRRNKKPPRLRDPLFLKTLVERWPARTWLSPKERVLHQFHRLAQLQEKMPESLKLVTSSAHLDADPAFPNRIHALMAVEGLGCLEKDLNNVELFYDRGIRILGPVHFFDTEVGGSAHGEEQYGLTDFGGTVMKLMKKKNMIVDLAHASTALMSDILDLPDTERPTVILSHTGVAKLCHSSRGLTDEYIRKIVSVGGLIGVALFKPAMCGDDIIKGFVDAVLHIKGLVGSIDNVAMGSDWDGSVYTISADRTHLISSALLALGNFSSLEVRQIMMDNAVRFFKTTLPR